MTDYPLAQLLTGAMVIVAQAVLAWATLRKIEAHLERAHIERTHAEVAALRAEEEARGARLAAQEAHLIKQEVLSLGGAPPEED